ncbi:MAG: hypothetical protein WCX65_05045 [bacterium]
MAKSNAKNGSKKSRNGKSYQRDTKVTAKSKKETKKKKDKILLKMPLSISGYIYTLRVIDSKSRDGVETGYVYSGPKKLIEIITGYGTVEGLPILYHELFEAVASEFEHYYTSIYGRNVIYAFNHTEMYQIMQQHLILLRTVLSNPKARKIFSIDQNLLDAIR